MPSFSKLPDPHTQAWKDLCEVWSQTLRPKFDLTPNGYKLAGYLRGPGKYIR